MAKITIYLNETFLEYLRLIQNEEGASTRTQTILFLINRYIIENKLKKPPSQSKPSHMQQLERTLEQESAIETPEIRYLHVMERNRYYHFDELLILFRITAKKELETSEVIVITEILKMKKLLHETKDGYYRTD